MAESKILKVTQVRSAIGTTGRQRQTLKALGLTRRGRTVEVRENPMTLGQLRKVLHLVEVSE